MNRSLRSAALAISALAVGTAVVLTGCSPDPTASAGAPPPHQTVPLGGPGRVGVPEFAAVISSPGVQIVDVRTPEEFAAGHLEGAVNIPVQAPGFAAAVENLDPAATYAVYCRSGNRSKPAVAAMKNAGITDVYELSSGTNGWTSEGRPLVR